MDMQQMIVARTLQPDNPVNKDARDLCHHAIIVDQKEFAHTILSRTMPFVLGGNHCLCI